MGAETEKRDAAAAHTPRNQIAVFVVLVILTLATAGASQTDLAAGPLVAYAIALVQGTLILLVLMHVAREKRSVLGILALTAVLVAGLVILSVAAYYDVLEGSKWSAAPAAVEHEREDLRRHEE